jgi:hypothetical protein
VLFNIFPFFASFKQFVQCYLHLLDLNLKNALWLFGKTLFHARRQLMQWLHDGNMRSNWP